MSLLNDVKKAIEEVKMNGGVSGHDHFSCSFSDLEAEYTKFKEYARKFHVGDFLVRKYDKGAYRYGSPPDNKMVVVAKHESGCLYVRDVLESGRLATRVHPLWISEGVNYNLDPDYAGSKILEEEFDPDKKPRDERNRQARFRKKLKEALVIKDEMFALTPEFLRSLKDKELYLPDYYCVHSWCNHILAKDIKEWKKIHIKEKKEVRTDWNNKKRVCTIFLLCSEDGKAVKIIEFTKDRKETWERQLQKALTNKPVEVL